jgi:hydroxylamine reductase (hybrid-cluster protein)
MEPSKQHITKACTFCMCCVLCCAVLCSFGTPTPTKVSLDPVEGKCILITGHDMHDLHELLKQTEGKVNKMVYIRGFHTITV